MSCARTAPRLLLNYQVDFVCHEFFRRESKKAMRKQKYCGKGPKFLIMQLARSEGTISTWATCTKKLLSHFFLFRSDFSVA